jgi:hypothetical protein
MRKVVVLMVAVLALVSCSSDDTGDEAESATTSEAVTTSTEVPDEAPGSADELVVTVLGTTESHDRPLSFWPSVVVPPDGLPFMVYLDLAADPSGREVVAVKCADPACAGEVVSTPFETVGQPFADIAIGPDGLPSFTVMAYAPGGFSPPTVRLVRCLEPACVDHTVTELGPGVTQSLVVPDDDLPLVIMIDDETPQAVKCTNADCSERVTTEVSVSTRCNVPTVRLGPDGLPVLASCASEVTDDQGIVGIIEVLYCADPACTEIDLATEVEVDGGTMLVGFEIGPDGPVFAFATPESPLRGLRVVRCLDQRCEQTSPVSLIGPNQPVTWASMTLGADGLPVLVYSTLVRPLNVVQVARCNDPDCTAGTVATVDTRFGQFMEPPVARAVALDDADRPIVVYERPRYLPPVDLLVARCADAACIEGAAEVGSWDQESSVIELEPVGEIILGWTAVADETVFGTNDLLFRVLPGGPGLLAFGADCELISDDTPMDCNAAVWGSANGIDWEQVASIDTQPFSGIGGGAVLVGGPGFVAASTTCMDPFEATDCGPVIWTSVDGTDWDQVPVDEDIFPPCGPTFSPSCHPTIDLLVTLPSGDLLAVATNFEGDAIAWRSTNGRDWRIADDDFDPFGSGKPEWFIDNMAQTGSGVIAVGVECFEKTIPVVGVSLSDTDGTGVEVDRISSDSAAQDAGLEVGDIIVAIDGAPVTDTASVSELRAARQPGDTVEFSVLRNGEPFDLELTYGGFDQFYCQTMLATSTDGAGWTPVANPLTAEGESSLGSFTEWAGGLASAANVCDGFERCENIVVTSSDGGLTWQRLPDDGTFDEDGGMFRVFPLPDGGLLVFQASRDEQSGQIQASFVTNTDGTEWTHHALDPDVFAGEIFVNDAIEHDGRLVAVGSSTSAGIQRPEVWVYEPPE